MAFVPMIWDSKFITGSLPSSLYFYLPAFILIDEKPDAYLFLSFFSLFFLSESVVFNLTEVQSFTFQYSLGAFGAA